MNTTQQETLQIEGMSCGHCVRAVEDALADLSGVEVEEVAIGLARVRYDPDSVSRDQIVHAVEEEGYVVA